MRDATIALAVAAALSLSNSAAALGSNPQPKLYPNKHLAQVGEAQAQRDVTDCGNRAAAHVHNSKQRGDGLRAGTRSAAKGALLGTIGGAIAGDTGKGAAAGALVGVTASAMKGVRESGSADPAYQRYVNACLADKGYSVIEWG